MTPPKIFFSAKEISACTGLSRTTLWRLETAGEFPARVKLSSKRVGWLVSEVMGWAASQNRKVAA